MVVARDDAYRVAPLMPASSWHNSVVLSLVYRQAMQPRYSQADKRAAVVAAVASAEWTTHKMAVEEACY